MAKQPTIHPPSDKLVYVMVEGFGWFKARYSFGAAVNEADEQCCQWQAEYEGEHPDCWTDGGCWKTNADNIQSAPVKQWRPIDDPTTKEGT